MRKEKKIKKILLFGLLVYAIVIFINQQTTLSKIKSQRQNKQLELDKVTQKNKKLQDEIELSQNDSYIEKIAREKLNLIKEGETPVINNSTK